MTNCQRLAPTSETPVPLATLPRPPAGERVRASERRSLLPSGVMTQSITHSSPHLPVHITECQAPAYTRVARGGRRGISELPARSPARSPPLRGSFPGGCVPRAAPCDECDRASGSGACGGRCTLVGQYSASPCLQVHSPTSRPTRVPPWLRPSLLLRWNGNVAALPE
jgi:hypothetical protein